MRWLVSLLVFLLMALASHFIVLGSIPGFIMNKAHATFEAQGLPQNVFLPSPRQTPTTQRIVRPSPDLAYALCLFDTSDGPVRITAPIGEGYGSVSIFNDQTDNVFVGDLSPGSDFDSVTIGHSRDKADPKPDVLLNGAGIALIRRLAPTQAEYDRAAALVSGAACEKMS